MLVKLSEVSDVYVLWVMFVCVNVVGSVFVMSK